MDVGVRELKQQLSKYVERAAKGETIRITDRGVPRALLAPLPGTVHLAEGIAEGWVTPGQDEAIAKVRRSRARERIADVLGEDRGA